MSGTIVCGVCGTVNVGVFARCIACGQELGRAVSPDGEDTDTGSRDKSADVPLKQESDVTGAVTIATGPAAAAPRSRSDQAQVAAEELDSASYRQTVIEMPRTAPVQAAPATVATAAPAKQEPASARRVAASPSAPAEARAPRFSARLLLPEGDRRSIDLSKGPVLLGSGLDELGLPGDPRADAGEARLFMVDGRLFVEPTPNSQNVYLRCDREVKLSDGDVILMGDVAASFMRVAPGGAVDGKRQVLGGNANAACGRLVFLRRDGSAGPVHDLPAGKTVVGRTDGHVNFPNDSRLSRRHALFFASDQGVTVEDMESRNGTYLRVRSKVQLNADDALRVGSAGVQIRVK